MVAYTFNSSPLDTGAGDLVSKDKEKKINSFLSFLVSHKVMQLITTDVLDLLKCGAVKRPALN